MAETEKQKLLLVVNPISGKKMAKQYMVRMIHQFDEAGYAVTACCTQKDKNAYDIVLNRGADFDRIVCVGGDGTLKETVCGVIELGNHTPIGYVPMGSTNDFAHSIGIPVGDVPAAVQSIIHGERAPLDMGYFGKENFIYVAGFGNFTALSYDTSQKLKNALGRNAYYLGAVRDFFKMHGYPARVEVDGEVFEDEYFYGALSNSYSVGGMPVLHNMGVKFDDGLYELVLVKMFKTPKEMLQLVHDMLHKTVKNNPLITIRHCNHVKFIFDEPTDFTLDGEFGGSHTEIEAGSIPHAVDLLIEPKEINE